MPINTYELTYLPDATPLGHVSAESRSKARWQGVSYMREWADEVNFAHIGVRLVAKDAGKDPYEYVRRVYGVPASVGATFTYQGAEFEIVRPGLSNTTCYVHIIRNGRALALHPREAFPKECVG